MVALRISVRKDLHRQQKLEDAGLSCFSSSADPNGKRKGLAAEFTIRQQVPLLVFFIFILYFNYSRVRSSQSGAQELILGHPDMKLST